MNNINCNNIELKSEFEFHGIIFSIDKVEAATMKSDDNAYIIYLKIANKTDDQVAVSVTDISYITQLSEQINIDSWLSGYMKKEAYIRKSSYQLGGLIFFKSKLKEVQEGDRLCLTTCLFSKKLTICFIKSGDYWKIENTQVEIILTPEQIAKHVENKIERLVAFEERYGLSIQNLSIKISKDCLLLESILCEVQATEGTEIKNDVRIECAYYRADGSIMYVRNERIRKDEFFAFKLIDIPVYDDIKLEDISKIRIYPTI